MQIAFWSHVTAKHIRITLQIFARARQRNFGRQRHSAGACIGSHNLAAGRKDLCSLCSGNGDNSVRVNTSVLAKRINAQECYRRFSFLFFLLFFFSNEIPRYHQEDDVTRDIGKLIFLELNSNFSDNRNERTTDRANTAKRNSAKWFAKTANLPLFYSSKTLVILRFTVGRYHFAGRVRVPCRYVHVRYDEYFISRNISAGQVNEDRPRYRFHERRTSGALRL